MLRPRLAPLLFVATALAAACGPGSQGDTAIVVGLQGEDFGGLVQSIRVSTQIGGAQGPADTFGAPFFPHETRVAGTAGQELRVRVEAFSSRTPAPGEPAVLTRTARAPFVGGQERLLRLRLESRCITGLLGGLGGPTCTAPHQTCIAGACKDDGLVAADLEPYRAGWAEDVGDACKPPGAGPAEVIVGTGQTDYLPLADDEEVKAEAGPQGGHHVYVALRMRNLRQSGSTTTISGRQPDTGVEVPSSAFIFSFDRDEGGYCKLYGLRYQFDVGGVDYTQFLGKPFELTVTVKDASGTVGTGKKRLRIAPTLLGE
jgi:hypothetical protein